VFGNYGVLQGISKGKCYVEMSTIDEETMQDVAEVGSVSQSVPYKHVNF
jgi:3-hydroxyisobutyrate dehydrogenase-like beta-hydroxyacid dehydrogenase